MITILEKINANDPLILFNSDFVSLLNLDRMIKLFLLFSQYKQQT
jgi:hypothetical protein